MPRQHRRRRQTAITLLLASSAVLLVFFFLPDDLTWRIMLALWLVGGAIDLKTALTEKKK